MEDRYSHGPGGRPCGWRNGSPLWNGRSQKYRRERDAVVREGSALHRYLSEFDFRYNVRMALGVDDMSRFNEVLSGVSGKRLTYQTVT